MDDMEKPLLGREPDPRLGSSRPVPKDGGGGGRPEAKPRCDWLCCDGDGGGICLPKPEGAGCESAKASQIYGSDYTTKLILPVPLWPPSDRRRVES